MYYVYILTSKKSKSRFYIGITNNLDRRLKEHADAKGSNYTVRHAPWELETYVAFKNRILAENFELYLKSHSGRAFLLRRLMAP
jgi:predicted GIY-YIG superfamily endonuclease